MNLSNLQLTNFRNYQTANFHFDSNIIVIYGSNGAGKTNILEAISLLGRGHGIRGAEFFEMINNLSSNSNFTIFAKIKNHPFISNIATSYSKIENKKIFQIDGKIQKNSKLYPVIIWLSPQMDGLFLGQKTIRRKFLDKIVSDIDAAHSTRINNYEKLIRERLNLLEKYGNNDAWLNIVEGKIVELGSAIAIARNQAVEYLNQAMILGTTSFIKTKIKIIGEIEELSQNNKAILVEEKFLEKLKENRKLDLKTGRTSFGVHRSDFTAIMIDKNLKAKFCSTGEQKSMLIALTFARTRMASLLGLPPSILLLDEIVSHLDINRRKDLFSELINCRSQCFLTGTDKEAFMPLEDNFATKPQFINITSNLS